MKEKIKKHISKHIFLYSAILIFFCIAGYGLGDTKLVLGDEMFNFANAFKLANGVKLYSENNVIITPLFFYGMSIIFKVFGSNVLIFKIINIITFEIIIIIIIKMLKKLDVPVHRAVVYILLLIFPFLRDLFICGNNYNTLAMLFWVLGMYLVIKKDKLEVKVIEQGIISAIIFATKQNIGLIYLLALTIYTIYNYKKELKQAIKKLFGIYLLFAILTGAWCIALYLDGQFFDFINYCFLGMGEFSNENLSASLANVIYYIIPIALLIGFIIARKKIGIKKESMLYKVTVFFSIFMFVAILIGYPIFNIYHVKLSLIPSIILLMYFGDCIIRQILELCTHKAIIITLAIIISILVIYNVFVLIQYILRITNENYELNYSDAFYGFEITEEYKNDLNDIKNFVQEKEKNGEQVIIFSATANLYEVPLGRNIKDYDLPHLGNWGYKGEERIINEIKNFSHTYILMKDEDWIGQESTKAKEVIKSEYKQLDDIAGYNLYYKE